MSKSQHQFCIYTWSQSFLIIMLILTACETGDQDGPLEFCGFRAVGINITNEASKNLGIQFVITGCEVDNNPNGFIEGGFLIVKGESNSEETGTFGAKSILVNLIDPGPGDTVDTFESQVTEEMNSGASSQRNESSTTFWV